MKLSFEVTTSDGKTEKVDTAYADILALEQKFDIDASDLATRQRAQWLAYMAWHAMKRQGITSETYDKWSQTLVDLNAGEASPNE
jgi:hypothetical protein